MNTDDRLPTSLLEAVAAHGSNRTFRANTILINEGDPGASLYIVLEGRLRAYASSAEGRDVVLSEHGPGEYVGELSLDGSARSASVKTVEATTCCVVQGPQLQSFLAAHPEFALHLSQKLTRMVRRLTEQVKSLALQDVYGRMVRLLMELSEPVGEERTRAREADPAGHRRPRRLVARNGQSGDEGSDHRRLRRRARWQVRDPAQAPGGTLARRA